MRLAKLVAAGFTAALLTSFAAPAFAQEHGPAAEAHGEEGAASGGHHLKEPAGGFTFEGPFGSFDKNALQRGYKVYREVCSSCHSMKLMSFRNLGEKGGPFGEDAYPNPNDNPYVKTIASEYTVASVDPETGDAVQIPATTASRFPSPYANEAAARGMNGGALPPDLSVITKARVGGAAYVYSVLTGYYAAPAGLHVAPGQHYNAYFHGDTSSSWTGDPRNAPAGGFLAMAPPLTTNGQVTFDDGTEATVSQMAADVATFLAWAGEPKVQTRKQMGIAVLGYLFILALLTYISYRQIWRNVEH
jgi:ubiquinol-cytochrome c reductase cytochrome c1 subunit